MVKANAYNHGIEGVIGVSKNIVDRYGIATLEEGIQLRNLGVSNPISVFSYTLDDIKYLKKYNITPVVYNFKTLHKIIQEHICEFDIKIDSGMRRFGFSTLEECEQIVKTLKANGLTPRSLMTHFKSKESISEQVNVFNALNMPFVSGFKNYKLVLSASSGVDVGAFFDGVRVGLNAYKNALSVHSNILDVKNVTKGDAVGYDGYFCPSNDTRIAIISGGYYDGIKRSFSGAPVMIRNKIARIVGKICMDTTIIDIGDIKAEIGDDVIIFNTDLIDEYLKIDKTTNEYELLTTIQGRIARGYIYHGQKYNPFSN